MKSLSLYLFLSLFMLLLYPTSYALCLVSLEQKDNTFILEQNIAEKTNNDTKKIINKIKTKSNEIRMMYNTINKKNENMPIYIFVNDENEQKRKMLKNLFLIGKLDHMQGYNTAFSKYFLSIKNTSKAHGYIPT
ncbi:conserved Plasmodium protein, unknown function [Plasmodium malariae]|uniref:Uncharacterized protein n=1 Tax=Plasmodium malariae TaxID=5858 RepID=A0A1A8WGI9_PLAMA|nr:conserved Plasmodium protein, unknown function [Plasmodium malariae]